MKNSGFELQGVLLDHAQQILTNNNSSTIEKNYASDLLISIRDFLIYQAALEILKKYELTWWSSRLQQSTSEQADNIQFTFSFWLKRQISSQAAWLIDVMQLMSAEKITLEEFKNFLGEIIGKLKETLETQYENVQQLYKQLAYQYQLISVYSENSIYVKQDKLPEKPVANSYYLVRKKNTWQLWQINRSHIGATIALDAIPELQKYLQSLTKTSEVDVKQIRTIIVEYNDKLRAEAVNYFNITMLLEESLNPGQKSTLRSRIRVKKLLQLQQIVNLNFIPTIDTNNDLSQQSLTTYTVSQVVIEYNALIARKKYSAQGNRAWLLHSILSDILVKIFHKKPKFGSELMMAILPIAACHDEQDPAVTQPLAKQLLNYVLQAFESQILIDVVAVCYLTKVLQHALAKRPQILEQHKFPLDHDDCVRILNLLGKHLQKIHVSASSQIKLLEFLKALSHLLNIMVDQGVNGLDASKTETLAQLLKNHYDNDTLHPSIRYYAYYALQALACLPDEQSVLAKIFGASYSVVKGVIDTASAVVSFDAGAAIDGLKAVTEMGKDLQKIYNRHARDSAYPVLRVLAQLSPFAHSKQLSELDQLLGALRTMGIDPRQSWTGKAEEDIAQNFYQRNLESESLEKVTTTKLDSNPSEMIAYAIVMRLLEGLHLTQGKNWFPIYARLLDLMGLKTKFSQYIKALENEDVKSNPVAQSHERRSIWQRIKQSWSSSTIKSQTSESKSTGLQWSSSALVQQLVLDVLSAMPSIERPKLGKIYRQAIIAVIEQSLKDEKNQFGAKASDLITQIINLDFRQPKAEKLPKPVINELAKQVQTVPHKLEHELVNTACQKYLEYGLDVLKQKMRDELSVMLTTTGTLAKVPLSVVATYKEFVQLTKKPLRSDAKHEQNNPQLSTLEEVLDEFLKTMDSSVLLIQGPAGSGKSIAVREFAERLWSQSGATLANDQSSIHHWIPIVIAMGQLTQPNHKCIEQHLKNLGFSPPVIDDLRKNKRLKLLIILDGIDEANSSIVLKQALADWLDRTAKIIVTCRTDYLPKDYHALFQIKQANVEKTHLLEYFIAPFDEMRIKTYISEQMKNSEQEWQILKEKQKTLLTEQQFLQAQLDSLPGSIKDIEAKLMNISDNYPAHYRQNLINKKILLNTLSRQFAERMQLLTDELLPKLNKALVKLELELENKTQQRFEALLKLSGVTDLLKTPFTLKVMLSILFKLQDEKELNLAKVLEIFFDEWSERESARLTQQEQFSKLRPSYNVEESARKFAEEFALELLKYGLTHVPNPPDSYTSEYEKKNNIWYRLFALSEDPHVVIARLASPLMYTDNAIFFIHKSIWEYCLARLFHRALDPLDHVYELHAEHPYNTVDISKQSGVLELLRYMIQDDDDRIKHLQHMIDSDYPQMRINALRILTEIFTADNRWLKQTERQKHLLEIIKDWLTALKHKSWDDSIVALLLVLQLRVAIKYFFDRANYTTIEQAFNGCLTIFTQQLHIDLEASAEGILQQFKKLRNTKVDWRILPTIYAELLYQLARLYFSFAKQDLDSKRTLQLFEKAVALRELIDRDQQLEPEQRVWDDTHNERNPRPMHTMIFKRSGLFKLLAELRTHDSLQQAEAGYKALIDEELRYKNADEQPKKECHDEFNLKTCYQELARVYEYLAELDIAQVQAQDTQQSHIYYQQAIKHFCLSLGIAEFSEQQDNFQHIYQQLNKRRNEARLTKEFVQLGRLLCKLGRQEDASQCLHRVVALETDGSRPIAFPLGDAYFTLGEMALQTQKYEQAVNYFELCVETRKKVDQKGIETAEQCLAQAKELVTKHNNKMLSTSSAFTLLGNSTNNNSPLDAELNEENLLTKSTS